MEKIRVEGKALKYVAVHPKDYDPAKTYPLVTLLHGYGSNMHDLAGLAPAINDADYIYVCPNAPLEIPLAPGMKGFAWMPLPEHRTEHDVEYAEAKVLELLDEVRDKYNARESRLLLGGFSQGAMLTFRIGLPKPETFAGLLALSGFIDGKNQLDPRLPASRSQPVFMSHGIYDSVIPVEMARQSRDFLLSRGYKPVYNEYPMGHEINQSVLDDLIPWIEDVLSTHLRE